MTGGARPPAPPLHLHLVEDVDSAFYLHLDVADQPGVLAAGDEACSAITRSRSARSCSAAWASGARLVMVTHAVLESRLRAARARLAEFEFVRSTPRMIRVIEEEFV